MRTEKHSSGEDAEIVRRLIQSAHEDSRHKVRRAMRVKQLHSGGYHVIREHEDGSVTEHAAPDLGALHDHIHEHFGEGEAQQEGEQ